MIVTEVRRTMPQIESPEPSGPEVMQPDPHYAGWSDEDVAAEFEKVGAEHRRRRRMAEAESAARVAALSWAAAAGREDGDEWAQPRGAHDAYAEGAVVTHGGKTWVSLIDANVWEPGVSGWREQTEGGAPEWVEPSGAHDAYNTGDRVTFEGVVYESTIDANTWSPADYPAGWDVVS